MLFKSFIVYILTYCLPVLYTSIFSRNKKDLRKLFNQGDKLGPDKSGDLDSLIAKLTKNLALQLINNDEQFLKDFLK